MKLSSIQQFQELLEQSRQEGFAACQKQAVAALEEVKRDAYNDGYTMGQRNANEGPVTASQVHALKQENEQLRNVLELTRECNAAHLAEIKNLKQERHDWETLARERLEDVLNSQKEIAKLKKDNQNIAADGVRIFQEKSKEIQELNAVIVNQSTLLHSHLAEVRRLQETVCEFKDDILKKHGEIQKLTSDLQSAGAQIGALQRTLQDVTAQIDGAYDRGVEFGQFKASARFTALEDQLAREKEKLKTSVASYETWGQGFERRIAELQKKYDALLRDGPAVYAEGVKNGRAQIIAEAKNMPWVCPTAAPGPVEVRVGDVWRTGNRVRAISKIEPHGKIRYAHTFTNGDTRDDSAATAAEFLEIVGETAHCTRDAFSPASLPGDPAEGFMVGDVWTSGCKGVRTVLEVSAESITYQRKGEQNGLDRYPRGQTMFDWPWRNVVGPGSTLVRK